MTRTEFRKSQRAGVNAHQKLIAKAMGIPKGLVQFAKRHGVLSEDIARAYKKYQ